MQKRGNYDFRIQRCWFKSERFLKPYMAAYYRGPDSGMHYKRVDNPYYIAPNRFQMANCNLFQLVENLIHQYYPNIWEIYSNINVPAGCNKFTGLFAAVVINKMFCTKIYKDLGHIKGVICYYQLW